MTEDEAKLSKIVNMRISSVMETDWDISDIDGLRVLVNARPSIFPKDFVLLLNSPEATKYPTSVPHLTQDSHRRPDVPYLAHETR